MYLVIDTETTGLFDFAKPADAVEQPRLANVAMITLSDDMKDELRQNLYIIPDGWSMPPDAEAVNGLTDAILRENGLPIREVLETYANMIDAGHIVAAFNAQYDTKIMRGELRRAGMDDRFKRTPNICIMRALTNVCQIPRAKGKGYKFPKLEEACKHFGIPLDNRHTAMGDAIAVVQLMRFMRHLGIPIPTPEVHYATNRPAQEK